MKSIVSKKALDRAVQRALKAQYLVDTGVVGTVNMVILKTGGESFCEAWITGDNADSGSHPRFQAYGDHQSGEVLISNLGNPPTLHLIGKGKEEHGVFLLVQRTADVYTVVWNSDLANDKSVFFMTATADKILIQLITMLAEKHFPSIQDDVVANAVALLLGGDGGE